MASLPSSLRRVFLRCGRCGRVGRALEAARRRALVLVVAEMGGELGVEHAVDEALLELGKQAVGPEKVARIGYSS